MKNKHYKIGYTQGVYDMFHIGHLNLLNHAKERCDYLLVGINTDALVQDYKQKKPVIPERERLEIVSSIKVVDASFLVSTLDKIQILREHHFNAIFIGDDWQGNGRWKQTEKDMAMFGVDVVYLPCLLYTSRCV